MGSSASKRHGDRQRAIEKMFRRVPNRRDATSGFRSLTPEAMESARLDKFIIQLEEQLRRSARTIGLDDGARSSLLSEEEASPAVSRRPFSR